MDGLGKVQTKHPFPYNSRRSFSMKHIFRVSLLLILAFSFAACKPSKPSSQNANQSQRETAAQGTAPNEVNKHPQPVANPQSDQTKENDNEKSVYDLFVPKAQKSLSYNGYTITKTSKKVWVKEEREDAPIEVPYSILSRKGKIIRKFEFNDFTFTSPDFGWLKVSGKESKHLIVGQTEPRSGRFWVISLSPRFRVLFDTNDYGGSRQELWVEDIDKDGTYELKVVTYGCTSIGTTYNLISTPQPLIVFRYNKKADKYLPANHLLESYALKGTEDQVRNFKPTSEKPSLTNNQAFEEGVYFREMTEIFLNFIYAGKEKQAWAFFDKVYNLPDKSKVRASIKVDLRKDRIYRFIYRKQTKNRA
jgi:hypothetical protein